MGDDNVQRVLDDYRTAPIDERVRATLTFLEKMTLTPDALTTDDADIVRAAGVTDDMLDDAVQVCTAFNMIVRVADALEFDVPPRAKFDQDAKMLLRVGYG